MVTIVIIVIPISVWEDVAPTYHLEQEIGSVPRARIITLLKT
jgi:hypothetical protein